MCSGVCRLKKGLRRVWLSSLGDLEAPHRSKVKAKAEL
jgi:hypothetical protein